MPNEPFEKLKAKLITQLLDEFDKELLMEEIGGHALALPLASSHIPLDYYQRHYQKLLSLDSLDELFDYMQRRGQGPRHALSAVVGALVSEPGVLRDLQRVFAKFPEQGW